MGDTAKRVHRAATAARERAIQASNAEKRPTCMLADELSNEL
jgi:hypothetical protein